MPGRRTKAAAVREFTDWGCRSDPLAAPPGMESQEARLVYFAPSCMAFAMSALAWFVLPSAWQATARFW